MTTPSISVISNYDSFREQQNERNKELKGRNLSSVNAISVISAHDELDSNENHMVTEQEESALKCICKIITCTFATVGLSVHQRKIISFYNDLFEDGFYLHSTIYSSLRFELHHLERLFWLQPSYPISWNVASTTMVHFHDHSMDIATFKLNDE